MSEPAPPDSWSQIGRVPVLPGEVVTIAGRSFCLSGRSGNITELGPQGFFHDDTRFLSQLRLTVNGIDPAVVDAVTVNPGEAIFYSLSRSVEQPEGSEPGLVVRRHRYQGPALHEDVILVNRSGQPTAVAVAVEVQTDFADLLDVRLKGPAPERRVHSAEIDGVLHLSYAADDFARATEISTSEPAHFKGTRLTWRVSLEPGSRWKVCLDVVPVLNGVRVPVVHSCTTEGVEQPAVPAFVRQAPRLRSSADDLEHLWTQALADLAALEYRIEDRCVFAAGIPWFVALFGRDSIITAIEAMLLGREAGLDTAEVLAALQGAADEPAISEEPGKILHEVRFGERSRPAREGSRYYGTVDATPLFCTLLGELHRWGADPARLTALLPALRAAVAWMERRLERGDGLITYEGDPTRLQNHGWKDSKSSMVDGAGIPLQAPIGLVEVQGYAVAALRAAARLEASLGEGTREQPCLALADELQARIEERFWSEELGTFAMALGREGQVAAVTSSNPGHLLWAGAVAPGRAAAVARSLLSEELWSGWGVRTLSDRNPAYHPISYHRGSVWPHDTMLCLAGLRRYGLIDEALTLAGGLLAAASHFGYQYPEVFSGVGRVEAPAPVRYPTSSAPQAWAAAVPIYLAQELLGIEADLPAGRVVVAPRLPEDVEVRLEGVAVAGGELSLRATGRRAEVLRSPPDVDVVVR